VTTVLPEAPSEIVRQVEPAVRRVPGRPRSVDAALDDLPEYAGVDQPLGEVDHRREAKVVPHLQGAPGFRRRSHQTLQIPGVRAARLLHEHALARLETSDRVIDHLIGPRLDDHTVHGRARQHVIPGHDRRLYERRQRLQLILVGRVRVGNADEPDPVDPPGDVEPHRDVRMSDPETRNPE
jgi:hypothetical protein